MRVRVLGSFAGILHSDRWKPYALYSPRMRQICHSHLRRDIQAVIDRGGIDKALGERWLALSNAMFHEWHAYERAELDGPGLSARIAPILSDWQAVARKATAAESSKTRVLGKSMLELWPAMWNFLQFEGVQPTNNEAERAQRKGVKIRKNTFGSTSPEGARMIGHFLTVLGTAKRQGVRFVQCLVETREAFLRGVHGPALLLSG